MPPPLPSVIELPPLPRSQVGPFLLLGVAKDADLEAIEAGWAQRLIWARKNVINTPLEDINWAREVLKDHDRRLRADAASLNLDTASGLLDKLRKRFQGQQPGSGCQPIDVEKSLAEYVPPTPLPDLDEVRRGIPAPEVPQDVPAVRQILEEFVKVELDPWEVEI